MAPNLIFPLGVSERQKRTYPTHVEERDECLIWIGAKTKPSWRGYAVYGVSGAPTFILHRRLWEENRGPVPDGHHLDHLCRNRACINLDHIELVTIHENVVARGKGITARNAAKTSCDNGHALSAENLYSWKDAKGGTHRICRECVRVNKRAYRARRKALAAQEG